MFRNTKTPTLYLQPQLHPHQQLASRRLPPHLTARCQATAVGFKRHLVPKSAQLSLHIRLKCIMEFVKIAEKI